MLLGLILLLIPLIEARVARQVLSYEQEGSSVARGSDPSPSGAALGVKKFARLIVLMLVSYRA